MNKKIGLIIFLLSIFICTIPVSALTGDEILEKMDQSYNVETSKIQMTMTLINADGLERERTVEILSKGDNALVKFLEPIDVKDTALLLRGENGENDMWLYLPAIGSVRKVASHMQNGNFMGSDFTYQDFNMFGGEKYQDSYQQTEINTTLYQDLECYLLDTIPVQDDRGYSKIRIWVNQETFIALKLEFYDLDGQLLKVLTNYNINDVDGFLTPEKIVMENVQQQTKTVLEMKEITFNLTLPDKLFTTRELEK